MTHAAVLPSPRSSSEDVCEGERPVIGIVYAPTIAAWRPLTLNTSTTIQDEPTFIIYSLYRHRIVRKFVFPGLHHFQANESYIVLVSLVPRLWEFALLTSSQSTVDPPTLHILSAATLETLSSISSSSLAPFARKLATSPTPPPPNLYNTTTPLHPIYDNANIPSYNTSNTDLRVPYLFALSNRLLAFASPAPPIQRAMDSAARPSGRARSASRTSPLNQPTDSLRPRDGPLAGASRAQQGGGQDAERDAYAGRYGVLRREGSSGRTAWRSYFE